MIIKLKMKVEILEAYIPELFIKQLGLVARNLHFNKLSLMQVIHKSHSRKYLFLYQTLFIHLKKKKKDRNDNMHAQQDCSKG